MTVQVDLSVSMLRGVARGEVRRGALVTLSLDGLRAFGEASPLLGRSRESLDDVLAAAKRLGPVLRVDLARPEDALDGLPPSLELAIDAALRRIARMAAGETISSPAIESQVLGDDLLSIDRELAALARGATSFKLKVRTAENFTRVLELRRRAPHARLRVDANRAFARTSDVPWALLREARVEWIEEPTPNATTLRAEHAIALDESLEDDRDRALDAVAAGRVAAVVLKPTILGPRAVRTIASFAHAHSVRTVISHAFESEVGRLAALELASELAPDDCHGLAPWAGIDSFVSEASTDAATPLV